MSDGRDTEWWALTRQAADMHRAAISCKNCGGLPLGSVLVGEVCSCDSSTIYDGPEDDEWDEDDDYCEFCGVYLDGDINKRHAVYTAHCDDCGQDAAFLDGDDHAYDN